MRGCPFLSRSEERMSRDGYRRKLVAILCADAKDYSRLMGEDEPGTVLTRNTHFQSIIECIDRYRGRVVETSGDGMLAEFPSVVDAIRSAVEIQDTLKIRNGEMPEGRRMLFRIGVNLGDIIEEGGRISGDGVNIAARIERLADGGEILISGTAYDQVRSKLPFDYEFLGENTVKNINDPVRVYRVVSSGGGPAVCRTKRSDAKGWKGIMMAAVPGLVVAAVASGLWMIYIGSAPPRMDPAGPKPASSPPIGLPAADPADGKQEPRKAAPPASKTGQAHHGAIMAADGQQAPQVTHEPTIAVLPFENMTGDPSQDFLGDGLADDVITTLSKVPRLFVVSRNSTFAYKGKPVKVQELSRNLGVRYVLEGSVQRAVGQLRINAQLIDGATGNHIWSERYDREALDLFKIRDDLVLDIVSALQVELTDGEMAKIVRRNTNDLEAWEAMQRGQAFYERYNPEDNKRALAYFKKATELDPSYVNPWMMIGFAQYMEARFKQGEAREQGFAKAYEIAEKIVKMDPEYYGSYTLFSYIQLKRGRFDEAVANARKAAEMEPNNVHAVSTLAMALLFAVRPDEAAVQFEKAVRIAPNNRPWHLNMLGVAYHLAGRHEKAIEAMNKGNVRDPKYANGRAWLAAVYADLGREEEMRLQAAEVMRLNPKFSVKFHMEDFPFKDREVNERRRALLVKAGLPD